MGGKTIFQLNIRAEYTPQEREEINKYKLGGEVVYSSEAAKRHAANASAHLDAGGGRGLAKGLMSAALASMNLNITLASLQQGHQIECKDLHELVDAEQALISACENVKSYLEAAAAFDGREVIVDFSSGKAEVLNQRAA